MLHVAAFRTASSGDPSGCRVSDWTRFLRIVKHHRVAGLAHEGLRQAEIIAPEEMDQALHKEATAVTRQNLLFASESARLQMALDALEIPNLSVKGVTLSQLAYGSLSYKHSWDIDLLVTPDNLGRAINVLTQFGYRAHPPLPRESDPHYKHWVKYAHEYIFINEINGTPVELHWRLTDNLHFMPEVSANSPSRMVRVANSVNLRTLEDDDLFDFLCVHGAFHGWARLKWIADVAALISNESPERLEQRFATAARANTDYCAAQAFLLCDPLFAIPGLKALTAKLRKHRRYRLLEKMSFKILSMGKGEINPGAGSFDMLPLYISHLLLGHGWPYIFSDLRNKLQMPYDLLYSQSDAKPGVWYAAKRVFGWVLRRGRVRNPVIRRDTFSD
jgi:hypothetical protein